MKAMNENATHAVPPEEVMAYLDGEMSIEEAVAVAAHLRECAACAELAEELGGVSRGLRAWTVEAAPAGLERGVRKAVQETAVGTRRRVGRKGWVWVGALGVLLVTLFIAYEDRPMHKMVALEERREAFYNPPQDSASARQPSAGIAEMETGKSNFAALSQIAPGVAAPTPTMEGKADRYRGGVENLGRRGSGAPSGFAPQGPMIARTAALTVLVKNVADARASLEALMAREQGYAAQLTFSTPDGGARSLQASLRVPAGQLDPALQSLRALGRVEEEMQSGEEVTEQHADLAARLTNAREEETRLRVLLAQRTGKIEDVLEVEEEIALVRGGIEQMEAEQKGLEHRVDFASVEVKLVEEYTAKLGSPSESTGTRLHNGFVRGVRNADASLLNLVVFLEEFGPVLVIWAVILGVPVWLVWRRYRRARASAG